MTRSDLRCRPALLLALAAGLSCGTRSLEAADPIPPFPQAPGPQKPVTKNLDEWIAFVEGEYVTRRMLQREIGPRSEETSEADYERQVKGRVVRRVINGVLIRRAKLMGLEIRPDLLDEEVTRAAKEEVQQAKEREERRKPGAGASITFEMILAEKGQTLDEFKELIAREILVQQYWHILVKGVPGKRAQIDTEPSPADLDRLYRRHRDEFDQKHGVRLAVFLASPEAFLGDGTRTYEQSVEAARAHLEGLLAAVTAGRNPEDVAREAGLAKADWNVTPPAKFVERSPGTAMESDAWAFDPARRPKEARVFEGMRGMLVGIAVLEVRPARRRTYEEVLPDLIGFCRSARVERFRIQHMLEVIATATVQPREIADEIEGQLREALRQIDEDPVKRDIRLR